MVGGSIPSWRARLSGCPFPKNSQMNKVQTYLREVVIELRKATWPWDPKEKGFVKYKELTDATVVVLITMVLLAAFTGTSDLVLRNFVQFFLKLAA